MESLCRKCGNTGFYLQQRGMQVGMYCDTCGAWLKWVGKKELPMFKRRGIAILPQNAVVSLKNSIDLGVEKVDSMKNMGVDMDSSSFGVAPPMVRVEPMTQQVQPAKPSIDIELEIERRVAERLSEIEKNSQNSKNSQNEPDVDEGYCPVCEGNPLVAEGQSRVEVTIYSGVMTVTDPDGLNIFGLYKLKRCPFCGKLF